MVVRPPISHICKKILQFHDKSSNRVATTILAETVSTGSWMSINQRIANITLAVRIGYNFPITVLLKQLTSRANSCTEVTNPELALSGCGVQWTTSCEKINNLTNLWHSLHKIQSFIWCLNFI